MRNGDPGERNAPPPSRAARCAGLLWPWAVVVCAGVLLWQTKDYGFQGQDTYPILRTSRILSPADFFGTFAEGLQGNNNFYRPFLHFSVALDYALWGLRPIGYQLTNVLLFAGCAAAVGLLVRRALGAGSGVAQLVAVGAFLLFPAHFEVLPVVARRPELLLTQFGLLSIWCQLSPRALAGDRVALLPALFALLAMGSKDNGLVVPLLCFVAALVGAPRSGLRPRARRALRAMVPHGVVLAVFWAVRSRVVEGFSGKRVRGLIEGEAGERGPWEVLAGYPEQIVAVLDRVVRSEPLFAPSAVTGWLALALAVALVAADVLGRFGTARRASMDGGPGRLAAIAAAWLLVFALLYAVRGVMKPWYAFVLAAGWAILLGAVTRHLCRTARHRLPPARAAAGLALALLVTLVGWTARTSPVVHRYSEWAQRTRATDAFYGELRGRLEAAAPGATIEVPPLPAHVRRPRDRPFVSPVRNVTKPAILAWIELTLPDAPVRLVLSPDVPEPRPGEILLVYQD